MDYEINIKLCIVMATGIAIRVLAWALGVIVVMALMFYNQMAVLSNQKTVLSNQKQIEAKQTNLNTQINRIEGASHE